MKIMDGLKPKHYALTGQGLDELQQQLSEMKNRRRQVAAEILETRAQGTSNNSPEELANNNSLTELDDRIEQLERIIVNAQIISQSDPSDFVRIGSKVTVDMGGEERVYTIVSPVEADPSVGKVSNESPVGLSLLGKKINECAEIMCPKQRRISATILQIN